MPIYTLKDTKTQDEWDVQMSYDDLQIVLDENPEFLHVLKPLKIAANAGRSNLSLNSIILTFIIAHFSYSSRSKYKF